MHELGIVFHVIRAVEDIGRQQQLTDVASVTLELGQVSGVVPHELESCWKWAVARTELMPRAQLRFETVHAITHCDGCGRDYDTVPQGRVCPFCGSEDTWRVQGTEGNIKEIEAQ